MSKLGFLWALMVGGSFPRSMLEFESQGLCLVILNIWIKVSDKKLEFPLMNEKKYQLQQSLLKWKQIDGFGEIKQLVWVPKKRQVRFYER